MFARAVVSKALLPFEVITKIRASKRIKHGIDMRYEKNAILLLNDRCVEKNIANGNKHKKIKPSILNSAAINIDKDQKKAELMVCCPMSLK